MRIRFFGDENDRFSEFQDLTINEAGEAVDLMLPFMELYLDAPGRDPKWEPELGLVFRFGVYRGFGLGGTEWSKPIETKFFEFIGLPMTGADVVALLKD